METEHFQAPLRVITFRRIQIENNQIEKPSAKELPAWLLSKLHIIRQLNYRLKMIIQTECCRESSCKKSSSFFGLPNWEFEGKYYYLARKKTI